MQSKKFSFENWKFVEWFKGNSKTIKEIAKVGVPYLVSLGLLDAALGQFLVTVVGKFVIDCAEFYFKQK